MRASIASTQWRFAPNMSRSGAQKGLSDHMIPTLAVPTVI